MFHPPTHPPTCAYFHSSTHPHASPTCIFRPQYHPTLLLANREESGGKNVLPFNILHQH